MSRTVELQEMTRMKIALTDPGKEMGHTAMLNRPAVSCLRMKFSSANDLVP